MTPKALLIFVLLLASTMIGCIGGDDDDTSSETTDDDGETPQSNNIDITGFAFSPETLTISVGDTVIWTNKDSTTHTATADGEFDSGNLGNGDTFSHTFTTAGTYTYYCKIHTSMTATIVVE